jgi:hypothetical protein
MCKKGSRENGFDKEQAAALEGVESQERKTTFVGPPGGVRTVLNKISLSLILFHQAFWDSHGLAVPVILETSYQLYILTVNTTEFHTQ